MTIDRSIDRHGECVTRAIAVAATRRARSIAKRGSMETRIDGSIANEMRSKSRAMRDD
jgi:hypothetical protein